MNNAKKIPREFKTLRGRSRSGVGVCSLVFLLLLGGPSYAATLYAQYRADTGLLMNTGNVVTQWVDAAGTAADLDRVLGEPKRLALGNSNSTASTVARFDGFDAIWSASKDFGSVGGDRTVVVHMRLRDLNDGYLFDGSTLTGMTRSQVASGEWQVGIQPENASNPDPVTAAANTNVWQTHVFEYNYEARGFLDWDKYYIVSHYIDGVLQETVEIDENVDGSSGNGVGDPSIMVDRETGRIWAAALWSFGNNGWSGSGPGLTPEETGQYVLFYSDDDGETWSEPSSITETVKNPDWNLFFQGPGKGFMTREGVLIFPSQFKDASGVPHSNFIWSDDHGESWHRAPPAIPSGNPQTTEAQMVELDSGDLLISMRNHDGRHERLWCVYSWDHENETIADGSWGTPWFTQRDPTCMASVEAARSTRSGSPYEVLVFSNPDNTSSRVDMTIRASFDHGQTWPYRHKIDDRPAAYSCMTILPNGDIGILYETGDAHAYETLTFARFPLEWVTGNADGDGDGIPDHFEDATGLDKTNPEDAEIDSDSDGSSNLQEYMANTHPNSADSKLQLRVWMNGIQPHLQFQSVPYMDYRIEYSSDLVSWETLPGYSGISGQGSLITVEPDSSTAPCYYRVRVGN